jgi:hypothetical protein
MQSVGQKRTKKDKKGQKRTNRTLRRKDGTPITPLQIVVKKKKKTKKENKDERGTLLSSSGGPTVINKVSCGWCMLEREIPKKHVAL